MTIFDSILETRRDCNNDSLFYIRFDSSPYLFHIQSMEGEVDSAMEEVDSVGVKAKYN